MMAEARYDENLLLAYVEGEMTAADRRTVEGWIEADPRLARLLAGMVSDRQALRDAEAPEPPAWIIQELDEDLERQMLLGAEGDVDARANRQRHVVRRLFAAGAIAAMLLLAGGVVIVSIMMIDPGVDGMRSGTTAGDPVAPDDSGGDGGGSEVAMDEAGRNGAGGGGSRAAAESNEIGALRGDLVESRARPGGTAAEPEPPTLLSRDFAGGTDGADALADADGLEDAALRMSRQVVRNAEAESSRRVTAHRAADAGARERARSRVTVMDMTGEGVRLNIVRGPDDRAGGSSIVVRVQTRDPARSVRQLNHVAANIRGAQLRVTRAASAGVAKYAEGEGRARGVDADRAPEAAAMAVKQEAEPLAAANEAASRLRADELAEVPTVKAEAGDREELYELTLPADQVDRALTLLREVEPNVQQVAVEPRTVFGFGGGGTEPADIRTLWPKLAPDYEAHIADQLALPVNQRFASPEPQSVTIPVVIDPSSRAEAEAEADTEARAGDETADEAGGE